ncbi:hypothetical protein DNTS_011834 [Danionella cerebrum]|uniref:non-specific serine/threonine protein kinase n=1 Tax=Danionella cerebrum TaxID=2873325 RepID=A0A553RPH3_9TELE|nr:hypothetical protein DNTS_011834 [Danionella translucida]
MELAESVACEDPPEDSRCSRQCYGASQRQTLSTHEQLISGAGEGCVIGRFTPSASTTRSREHNQQQFIEEHAVDDGGRRLDGNENTSHIVEGHREHQEPELPFLESSSSEDPADPPVLQVSGDSSLVSSPVISPDPSVIIRDSGNINLKQDLSVEVLVDPEQPCNSKASHIVEGHREHQDPELPVLESSPVISPDPSVIISESGIISEIDSAATSRADDEKDSLWFSAKEEFIESSVSSAAGYSPEAELLSAAHTDNIFSRYQVFEKLGAGGFGSVFAAVHCQDGLKVALKFVHKTSDTEYIYVAHHRNPVPKEIGLSIMAASCLYCPNIIQLLDWEDFPDYYIMVLERPLPCMDLDKFLRFRGVLSEREAQWIMWQAVSAAHFCFFRGVFHRDIKLENLLVDPSTLQIKLIDFGCGDLIKNSAYTSFAGTKAYCPPEYFEKKEYHAFPATVYSLGILMFILLHGRFPTPDDLYYIENDWSTYMFSEECCHLMWSCLRCDPEQRIPFEQIYSHNWFLVGSADQARYFYQEDIIQEA